MDKVEDAQLLFTNVFIHIYVGGYCLRDTAYSCN